MRDDSKSTEHWRSLGIFGIKLEAYHEPLAGALSELALKWEASNGDHAELGSLRETLGFRWASTYYGSRGPMDGALQRNYSGSK